MVIKIIRVNFVKFMNKLNIIKKKNLSELNN